MQPRVFSTNLAKGRLILIGENQTAFQTVENPWETSEGRSPPMLIPKPAACTSVSAALRSKAQVADKVEVQEALPPAGVLGADPLSLMPQHFPREPAKRCFRATTVNQGGSTLCALRSKAFLTLLAAGEQAKCVSRQKSSPSGELQVADKVEEQEALPPAGVLGADSLSLMPQPFPCEQT